VICLGLLTGCGSSAPAFPVKGAERDIVTLAGSWQGEYNDHATSTRTGRIRFDLVAGRHTANGEVLMYLKGEPVQQLKIDFLRVSTGEVNGSIEPYLDPVCKCQALTQFTGIQAGNVISGTFVTELPTLKTRRSGSWRVSRN